MNLRLLNAADAMLYRSLRLDALQAHPEAFSTSYEEAAARPVEHVAGQLTPTPDVFTLGAFDASAQLLGAVTVVRETARKRRHVANVVAMQVASQHRRRGVGRALLCEAVRRAGRMEGLRQLRLSVTANNAAALHLYRAVGFRAYALEPCALQVDGRCLDEVHMVLLLRESSVEQVEIRRQANDEAPWELLLEADPSKDAVAAYLDGGQVWVAVCGAETVGVAVSLETQPGVVELKNLAVRADWQRKGLGTKLVQRVLDEARAHGAGAVEVGTGNSSLGPLALYQRCGFRVAGVDRDFFTRQYGTGIVENGIPCLDRIRLRREL